LNRNRPAVPVDKQEAVMADEIKPSSEESTEVEAHSVLDMQESEETADVEAHHCISVLSVGVAEN
jgi:hypothetical protein